ncbi:hypothetical protein [Cognatishimia maritima]|uniref:Uncharacterized protein n=1 Tax=Cognatishimia maritima TaxID=870908 RepID=A0A1M5I4S4_9RHOB|nr:hypothetical protein [Cognatishimia maritima]SHG23324.1 hypothetical protein SAMN04488044_0194 [Cognatishimia maritima]
MQAIHNGYRAVNVLWAVNWERLMFPAAILLCLGLGAQLGSMGVFWP